MTDIPKVSCTTPSTACHIIVRYIPTIVSYIPLQLWMHTYIRNMVGFIMLHHVISLFSLRNPSHIQLNPCYIMLYPCYIPVIIIVRRVILTGTAAPQHGRAS